MENLINLDLNNQKFPINILYHCDDNGNVTYECELKCSTISTFPYHKRYFGTTEHEALSLIAKDLVNALKELLDY
jgi:hypothetical protein